MWKEDYCILYWKAHYEIPTILLTELLAISAAIMSVSMSIHLFKQVNFISVLFQVAGIRIHTLYGAELSFEDG